jgi:hypothetical protein
VSNNNNFLAIYNAKNSLLLLHFMGKEELSDWCDFDVPISSRQMQNAVSMALDVIWNFLDG